jgi:hypothetical protein
MVAVVDKVRGAVRMVDERGSCLGAARGVRVKRRGATLLIRRFIWVLCKGAREGRGARAKEGLYLDFENWAATDTPRLCTARWMGWH